MSLPQCMIGIPVIYGCGVVAIVRAAVPKLLQADSHIHPGPIWTAGTNDSGRTVFAVCDVDTEDDAIRFPGVKVAELSQTAYCIRAPATVPKMYVEMELMVTATGTYTGRYTVALIASENEFVKSGLYAKTRLLYEQPDAAAGTAPAGGSIHCWA